MRFCPGTATDLLSSQSYQILPRVLKSEQEDRQGFSLPWKNKAALIWLDSGSLMATDLRGAVFHFEGMNRSSRRSIGAQRETAALVGSSGH
jgi:hypothetical protein